MGEHEKYGYEQTLVSRNIPKNALKNGKLQPLNQILVSSKEIGDLAEIHKFFTAMEKCLDLNIRLNI